MMKFLMGLHGTPPVQEPHHALDLDGGGVMERVYVPAQVCKFLIDSLQRHREGLCAVRRVWGGCVESWGSRGRSKQNEVLRTFNVSD